MLTLWKGIFSQVGRYKSRNFKNTFNKKIRYLDVPLSPLQAIFEMKLQIFMTLFSEKSHERVQT